MIFQPRLKICQHLFSLILDLIVNFMIQPLVYMKGFIVNGQFFEEAPAGLGAYQMIVARHLEPAAVADAVRRARRCHHVMTIIDVPDLEIEAAADADRPAKPDIRKIRQRVAGVQQALAAIGYGHGKADGFMGRRTRAAIRAFQRDAGLRSTGRISDDLVIALQTAPMPSQVKSGGAPRTARRLVYALSAPSEASFGM